MLLRDSYDVVIAGGGVIGSAIAYFVAADPDFSGRVLVVEKDASYQGCSTALSAGSIRQQFSTPINVQISQFAVAFLKQIDEHLRIEGCDLPDIGLKEKGYLFLASAAGEETLTANQQIQTSLGVELDCMDAGQLQKRFAWMCTEDLCAASLGLSGEGWFDAYALLQAFRSKARALGVEYLEDEVLAAIQRQSKIQGIKLRSAKDLCCGQLVNATGPTAAQLLKGLGLDLPVVSRKRCVFAFDCQQPIPQDCPLVVDSSGVYFRPEGDKFICGVSPPAERDPDCSDYEVDYALFDEIIWPALAHRVPAFEAIKLGHSWAGHYAYNVFDQNAILGAHPEIENLFLANGFSGHGLQQSPAVGRGISELLIHQEYRSLDLSALSLQRVLDNHPLIEKNVV